MIDVLKEAMTKQGLTIRGLGAYFGGEAVVQSWLDGQCPIPTKYYSRLNKILKIDLSVEAVQSEPIKKQVKKKTTRKPRRRGKGQ